MVFQCTRKIWLTALNVGCSVTRSFNVSTAQKALPTYRPLLPLVLTLLFKSCFHENQHRCICWKYKRKSQTDRMGISISCSSYYPRLKYVCTHFMRDKSEKIEQFEKKLKNCSVKSLVRIKAINLFLYNVIYFVNF